MLTHVIYRLSPRATLTHLSCSPNFPRASITRYTHATHAEILNYITYVMLYNIKYVITCVMLCCYITFLILCYITYVMLYNVFQHVSCYVI